MKTMKIESKVINLKAVGNLSRPTNVLRATFVILSTSATLALF